MTDKEVNKAESSNPKEAVPLSYGEKGQPRIITSSRFVQDSRKKDLQMPKRLCTFDNMYEDDAVFNSVDITNLHVTNALYNGKFVGKGSRKSRIAADFLNYCIRNMSYGTWMDAIQNAATDLQYGFSLLNIVTERRNYGQYKGAYVLKKLAPRDQKSVYGWIYDKNFREVKGFVQRPNLRQQKEPALGFLSSGVSELSLSQYYDSQYPVLRSDQLLHFTYNSTNNNPQGDSPLMHCYNAWKEKKLIEQYQLIAISKGHGGTLVLRVPSDLIEQAGNPETYPEAAAEYGALQKDAAAFNAGESSFIVLTSDADEVTRKYLYDIEMKGVEGKVHDFDTTEIITQKQKSIYNCFGTGFLLLGQDGTGSYAMSTNATSTHGYYVERNILQKKATIENTLVPKLLAINDIELDWKDMPSFEPADPDEFDFATAGAFIQRVGSVNKLTPKALEYLYDKAGFPLEGIEELDFQDKGQSRAGESKGSSGTGDSQMAGSNSATNSANAISAGVSKKLIVDGDKIIDTETDQVVNAEDLNNEGRYD